MKAMKATKATNAVNTLKRATAAGGALALAGATLAAVAFAASSAGDRLPRPIAALQAKGLEVVGRIEAPGGLAGYGGLVEQQPVSVYVTPDGRHAVIGTLVDAEGKDLSAAALEKQVAGPAGERTWKSLEASAWIRDGAPAAPRIVYAFTDPNCPYCNRFWNDARPWIEAGGVQVRHVMVGILTATSAGKAAALLAAADPSAALARHERRTDGGVKPATEIAEPIRRKLGDNQALMQRLGSFATPTLFYKDSGGVLRRVQGAPGAEALPEILGPRPAAVTAGPGR